MKCKGRSTKRLASREKLLLSEFVSRIKASLESNNVRFEILEEIESVRRDEMRRDVRVR